jgi:hypothetical protein
LKAKRKSVNDTIFESDTGNFESDTGNFETGTEIYIISSPDFTF